MFKATEVERKIREINLIIDLQINLSSCRISVYYFSLPLQRLLGDSLGTKNLSSTYTQIFGKYTNHGGRKDAVEITSCISS